jgi:hypothetical protein
MDLKHLEDEELAATAYVWHEKARLGDRHARQVAKELDAELLRRLGPTPLAPVPLGPADAKTNATRRSWCS